jgi:flagellar basal-body rod protein FlgB
MSANNMIASQMTEALGRFLDVDMARYKLIGANVANIDTPGYHTRDLDFRAALRHASLEDSDQESGVGLASFGPASHEVSGLLQRPDGNNVNLERESLLLAEAQMKFSLGVQLLKDQFHLISTAINSGGTSS